MERSGHELGQATLEYMLILMTSLALTVLVIRQFVWPTFEKIQGRVVERMRNSMFQEGNFHRLRLGR